VTRSPSGFDLDHTDRLLTTTRSVRKRLDPSRAVDLAVVRECIEIAVQAPTGGNSQRWRWLVVDDPGLRRGLADLYKRAHDPYMEHNLAAMGPLADGSTMQKVTDSSSHLADHLGEIPVHVIPCWLDLLGPDASNFDAASMYGSIVPAIWSFLLALRSRGLGSAWTTLHLQYEQEAAALLGIPDTVTQVALLPVAHYTGTDFRPADRRGVGSITYANAWGNKVGD
jgi:nitroreductase